MKVHIGNYPKHPNKERKISIRVDDWDVWDLYSTLAKVIVASLKKFREDDRSGTPCNTPIWEYMTDGYPIQDSFDFYKESNPSFDDAKAEWDSILGKMIYAFSELDDPQDADCYWIEKPEIDWDRPFTPCEDHPEASEIVWKVEGQIDERKRTEYYGKIDEGLNLFAKYFQNLWT